MRYLHQIDPIAFGLGNWNLPVFGNIHPQVHWYGIMYLLAFLVAWGLGRRRIRAGHLPGVDEADVRITWEPAWNQSMISEEGKMKLGLI